MFCVLQISSGGLHGFNTVSNLCSVHYRLAVEGLHGFNTVSNLCSVYYRLAVEDSMALTLFLTCVLCITDEQWRTPWL